MLSIPDEKSLIKGLKNGEYSSYKVLFMKLYSPLVNMACSVVRDRTASEDLVQEQFIKVWKYREKLDENLSIVSYLFVLTKRAILNYLRDLKTAERIELISEGALVSSWDPETDAGFNENMSILNARIETMPSQRRKIFIMSRKKGLSNEEIAKELGLSKRTVENHISLALRDLRKILS